MEDDYGQTVSVLTSKRKCGGFFHSQKRNFQTIEMKHSSEMTEANVVYADVRFTKSKRDNTGESVFNVYASEISLFNPTLML